MTKEFKPSNQINIYGHIGNAFDIDYGTIFESKTLYPCVIVYSSVLPRSNQLILFLF